MIYCVVSVAMCASFGLSVVVVESDGFIQSESVYGFDGCSV